MANKKSFLLRILVMALVLGMMVAGCNPEDDPADDPTTSDAKGIFTLTGIPSQYNGKYAFLEGEEGEQGLPRGLNYNASTDTVTYVLISNGSAKIPMWNADDDPPVRYYGNHTFGFGVSIWDSETVSKDILAMHLFTSVKFTDGSATRDWSAGVDDL